MTARGIIRGYVGHVEEGRGLLAAGNSQGLLEAGFSLSHIRSGLAQQQFALEPICFDEPVPLVACFHCQQGLGQQAPPFLDVPDIPAYNPSGGH